MTCCIQMLYDKISLDVETCFKEIQETQLLFSRDFNKIQFYTRTELRRFVCNESHL